MTKDEKIQRIRELMLECEELAKETDTAFIGLYKDEKDNISARYYTTITQAAVILSSQGAEDRHFVKACKMAIALYEAGTQS